ncbi:putative high mobility group B protein 11 [Brassica rapa]|uniref:HMG box domain-containing protein n=1 Tax=Brassica campestris TaxID=3711 RepID=M4FA96_BRACM|nr:putative high mobility group B protein 11 [Brassica rapa]
MSTNETLTDSQLQMVPAYGSSSDIMSVDGESSRTASYNDLVQNPYLFLDKLRDFLEKIGKTLEFPTVCGESLDLHQLFVEVTKRGGLQMVIKKRKAKEVTEAFNLKKPLTNAAYVIRKNYLRMLFEFEHVYFFRQPFSSFWEREEDVKRLVEYSAHDKGIQLGSMIDEWTIDGKFDDGYLVTVKMGGSQELKGVLYHSAPRETPRRRKKKAKLSHVDSLRPKFRRSGYNFFFAEEHKRLKAAYAGQERSLLKEIGNNWRNLSPSDREIYQGKGAEDMERYKMDMAAYKSFLDSYNAAGSVAATDDAVAEAEVEAEAEYEAEAGL